MKRRILAAVAGVLLACGGETAVAPTEEVVAFVQVSGDGQLGKPGATLAEPLVVAARDESGRALAGVTVTWSAGVGGGSVSPASGVTDDSGLVSTRWTLGPTEGIQTATARTAAGASSLWQGRAIERVRPIAFVSAGKLFMMNPDGTDEVQLTTRRAWSPAWSPDGTRLAFLAGEATSCSGDFGDLFVVDAITMSETQLTHYDRCSSVWPGGSRWSLDGQRIAYVKDKNIVVIGADGSGARTITVSNEDPAIVYPIGNLEWLPDGSGFVFVKKFAVNAPYTSLMAINADGSGERQVATSAAMWVVGFVPDGSRLALVYQGDAWDDLKVWLMDLDGANVQRVLGSDGILPFAWSPDGTQWMATVWKSGQCGGTAGWLVLYDFAGDQVAPRNQLAGCGTGDAAWRP